MENEIDAKMENLMEKKWKIEMMDRAIVNFMLVTSFQASPSFIHFYCRIKLHLFLVTLP